MKCSFCDTEMVLGRICGTSGHCAYWIPDGSGVEGALTVKRIEKADGLVVGSATRIGFFHERKTRDVALSSVPVVGYKTS